MEFQLLALEAACEDPCDLLKLAARCHGGRGKETLQVQVRIHLLFAPQASISCLVDFLAIDGTRDLLGSPPRINGASSHPIETCHLLLGVPTNGDQILSRIHTKCLSGKGLEECSSTAVKPYCSIYSPPCQ